MKTFTYAIIMFSLIVAKMNAIQINAGEYLTTVHEHFKNVILNYEADSSKIPRSFNEDGSIRFVKSYDWTSGFFPGVLWQLYIFSGNKKIKEAAVEWTNFIEKEQFNKNDHDIGFKIMCSVGQGYRVQKKDEQKKIIIQSAKTLISRFDAKIGAIKSWNSGNGKWNYPVIIDNMMNLELLFKATELTGDSTYYNIAVSHANTTIENHYRADESCYHVIDYDSSSGKILRKVTHQGYSDESAWARGQSWGLYGFTLAYRYTKDTIYFNLAKNIALFLMNHPNLPEDYIPYWDYNSPDIPNTSKDVSAAAIMASSLYELSELDNRNEAYLNFADKIIESIYNNYLLNDSSKPFFTTSSVGNKNRNQEVGVPIIYADYYFIEALMRRWAINNKYAGTSNTREAFELEEAAHELYSIVHISNSEIYKLRAIIENDAEASKLFSLQIEKARASLTKIPDPVRDIYFEGMLHSHPSRIRTMKSLQDISIIFSLTIARIVSKQKEYGDKLAEYIIAWASAMIPAGNAINLDRIAPIFVSYHLNRNLFSNNQKKIIENWIHLYGDSLIANVSVPERKKSNWYMKHIRLVSLIGHIINNRDFIEHARFHYDKYTNHSLFPDGTTYDFKYRDALHYHCSGLQALLEYLIIEEKNGKKLYQLENIKGGSPKKSVGFLIPFVDGTKEHLEWVNTTIEFDRRRSISGDPEYVIGAPFEHWKAISVLNKAQYFQPDLLNVIRKIYTELGEHYNQYTNWQVLFNSAMNKVRVQ